MPTPFYNSRKRDIVSGSIMQSLCLSSILCLHPGRIQPVRLVRVISVLFSQNPKRRLYFKRYEISSKHCKEKTVDKKQLHITNAVFRIAQNHGKFS